MPSERLTNGGRTRLLALLNFRRFRDPSVPCGRAPRWGIVGASPPWRAGQRPHYYLIEPLEGQGKFEPGLHRWYCFLGCGFEDVIELTGDEVWIA